MVLLTLFILMKKFLNILAFIWQLPQNLIGYTLVCIYNGVYTSATHPHYVSPRMSGGISLGNFILTSPTSNTKLTVCHEHGHQLQSLILGPLYLFVIGIPSIIWAGLHGTRLFPSSKYDYYKFYTERWADKLGKVQRDILGYRFV